MSNKPNIAYVSSILFPLFPFPPRKNPVFALLKKNGIGYMEKVLITLKTYENA
ncbi:MAG: hypothetical protein MJZ97_05885 [Bacteroidales bacterium]|nr:hypothetical protein [Bacteroidales bacterium]